MKRIDTNENDIEVLCAAESSDAQSCAQRFRRAVKPHQQKLQNVQCK